MTSHVMNLCQTNGAFFSHPRLALRRRICKMESNVSHQERRGAAEAGGLPSHGRASVHTLVPTKWSPPACKKGGEKKKKQATKC